MISIILVIPPFTSRFPQIDPSGGSSGASFWKGFLVHIILGLSQLHCGILNGGSLTCLSFNKQLQTVAIEFGAVLGVALAGFTADKYGRKHAIKM